MSSAQHWLEEAYRQAEEGHYLRQHAAAVQAAALEPDDADMAHLQCIIALVNLNRTAEAEAHFSALADAEGPTWIEAASWIAQGRAVDGRPADAEQLIARVESILDSTSAPRLVALARIVTSRVAQALDRPIEAIHAGEEALHHAETSDPETLAKALFHMGYLWLDLGFDELALDAFERGLEIEGLHAARLASLHIGASRACRSLRRVDAIDHASHAVRLHAGGARWYREGIAHLVLAEAMHQFGRIQKGVEEARAAITLFKRSQSSTTVQEAHLCLGRLLKAGGDIPAALKIWQAVLDEPEAAVHHPEATLLIGEHSLQPDHIRALEPLVGDTLLRPELRTRAADRLVRVLLDQGDAAAVLHWQRPCGEAHEALGAWNTRRTERVAEIREQIKAHQRESRLREAAEQAERARRDLLDLAAHDLRNPLSALVLMLDAAEEIHDADELRELVGMGRKAAFAMRTVLDEVLAASELIGDPEELIPVDLHQVTEESVTAFRGGAMGKGQALQTRLEPVTVLGVPNLLRSVVDNLVSNALKFSPRGGSIRVETRIDGEDVVLEVHDEGPGVHPDEADNLFERRSQGRARPTEGEPSTGLGLYLVRRVVLRHGGTVGIQSRPEGGSCFWVRLPASP